MQSSTLFYPVAVRETPTTATDRSKKTRRNYLIAAAVLVAVAVLGGWLFSKWEQRPAPAPQLPDLSEPDTWETKGLRQKQIIDRLVAGQITLAQAAAEVHELNQRPPVRHDYVIMGETTPQEFDRAEVEYRIAVALLELAAGSVPVADREALAARLNLELEKMRPPVPKK